MTEPGEKRTLNGHETRSRLSTRLLLHAAGDLVVEGGYANATLAAVGERAGYSRSLATARFGSKDRMIEALVDHIVTRWSVARVLPRTEGQAGLGMLVILLEAIRDQYARDPRSLRVLNALMFEALGPNEELKTRFAEFNRDLRESIAATIRRGVCDGSITADVDPDAEAQTIVALLRGVGYQWRLDPEEFDPVPPLDRMIEYVRTRLAKPARG